MMKQIMILAAAAALAVPFGAQAQDAGEAAVKKLGCLKCHSVSADKDGPSFKKSAAKYKGEAAQAGGVPQVRQGQARRRQE